jgi:hypothetical protein
LAFKKLLVHLFETVRFAFAIILYKRALNATKQSIKQRMCNTIPRLLTVLSHAVAL